MAKKPRSLAKTTAASMIALAAVGSGVMPANADEAWAAEKKFVEVFGKKMAYI